MSEEDFYDRSAVPNKKVTGTRILRVPFIGLFLPVGDLSKMAATFVKSTFVWGDLVSNIINFLIIAFIVFLAYKQLSRFKLVEDKTKPVPADKK